MPYTIQRNHGHNECGRGAVAEAADLLCTGKSDTETFVIAPHPSKVPDLTTENVRIIQFITGQDNDGFWGIYRALSDGGQNYLVEKVNDTTLAALAMMAHIQEEREVFYKQFSGYSAWYYRQPTGIQNYTPEKIWKELQNAA